MRASLAEMTAISAQANTALRAMRAACRIICHASVVKVKPPKENAPAPTAVRRKA